MHDGCNNNNNVIDNWKKKNVTLIAILHNSIFYLSLKQNLIINSDKNLNHKINII